MSPRPAVVRALDRANLVHTFVAEMAGVAEEELAKNHRPLLPPGEEAPITKDPQSQGIHSGMNLSMIALRACLRKRASVWVLER